MSDRRHISSLSRWLPSLVIVGMWLWFCGPMICGTTVVGFRDSAYLYFPMFEAIDAVWSQGKVPLWNPYGNFGMPMVADGTSSVFYPGKLIFCLRFLGYPCRYGLYLASHVLLAALATYWLARKLRCNRAGATLAAVSYAFGGPVIFQVTNVIYLVSAAWLPIALGCVWIGIQGRQFYWWLAAAVACAMMILGGDPQMTYHVGLIASATVFINGLRTGWARIANRPKTAAQQSQLWFKQLAGLVIMVVATSLLAAIQILPTARLAHRSERSAHDRVVNVYSVIPAPQDTDNAIDYRPLLENTDAIVGQYQFSLPPWSLIEMLAPNISGKPFPVNSRWPDLLPAGDRMWFASLYVGLIVFLLGLTQVRCWGRNRINVWVSWILLWFIMGSFGWYGATWLWREIAGVPADGPQWAAPVGGVYWWMSVMLPKYFSFRYPAKLFVLATLGISLLAGRSCSTMTSSPSTARWVGIGFGITGAAAIVGLLLSGRATEILEVLAQEALNPPTMYGPFQAESALQQGLIALLHTTVLSAICFGLIVVNRRQKLGPWLGWALVLLTIVDLSIANRYLLAEVPAEVFVRQRQSDRQLSQIDTTATWQSSRPTIVLANHFPLEFLEESSTNRLAELVDWQRQSLQARHHLAAKVRLIGSFHSIWPEKYQRFINTYVTQANRVLSKGDDWFFDPNFLLAEEGEQAVAFVSLTFSQDALQVHAVELTAGPILQDGMSDLLVGIDDDATLVSESYDWNEARYLVRLKRNVDWRWVELPVLYDSGWQVGLKDDNNGPGPVDSGPVDIRSNDRDLIEVRLPPQPGEYRLFLAYRPVEFFIGATVSLIAWSSLLLLVVIKFRPM